MNENTRETFIRELDREIAWQWRWERLNRRLNATVILTSWLSSFLILVLSFYQLLLGSDFQRWVILSIAVLSLIAVGIPGLSNAMRFQQKQQVYDQMARAYSVIRIQLLTGKMSLEKAVATFAEVHAQPAEKVIRDTA